MNSALSLLSAAVLLLPACGREARRQPTSDPGVNSSQPAEVAKVTRPFVIAHRGASEAAPENTLSSISLAMSLGADAVEFDVRVSKDGAAVLMHDETTKRIGGVDKEVAHQTLEELRRLDVGSWFDPKFKNEKIPTLTEALAAVPDGKFALVEIKSPATSVDAIIAELKKAPGFANKAKIISFDGDVCAKARAALPGVPVYLVVGGIVDEASQRFLPYPESYLVKAATARLTGLVADLRSLTPAYVAKAKSKNLKIIAWTANEPGQVRQLAEWAVEGIETDKPSMAVAAVGE